MSNLTDFFPSGGGGLTPKFQEFNSSGTFTPTQALIDAGGYIEVFLVGGGGSASSAIKGGSGGEVIIKKMYLTSTTICNVTIAASVSVNNGNSSFFAGSSAGGIDITAAGGTISGTQSDSMGAGWGATFYERSSSYANAAAAGSGVFGYGSGGAISNSYFPEGSGVSSGKENSGQGSNSSRPSGSGYCLIKWYE